MKRFKIAVTIAGIASALALWAFLDARLLHGQAYKQYPGYSESATPQIFYQNGNPGWAPPGSLWISATSFAAGLPVWVQTNAWNSNGTVIVTDLVVYVSGTTTSTAINGYRTNVYPTAGWYNISGTNTFQGGITAPAH